VAAVVIAAPPIYKPGSESPTADPRSRRIVVLVEGRAGHERLTMLRPRLDLRPTPPATHLRARPSQRTDASVNVDAKARRIVADRPLLMTDGSRRRVEAKVTGAVDDPAPDARPRLRRAGRQLSREGCRCESEVVRTIRCSRLDDACGSFGADEIVVDGGR